MKKVMKLDVFTRIYRRKLLEKITRITVIIEHTSISFITSSLNIPC